MCLLPMPSPPFEAKIESYLGVASLSVLLWDLLNNVKDEYRLLFRRHLGMPTLTYFLSRVSVLGFVLVLTIFLTAPSIPCTAFQATFVAFYIVGMTSTLFLSFLRVCAVWHWNRFIVGLFSASWLSVAGTGFVFINSIKGIKDKEGYCKEVIVGQHIMAPFITGSVNHVIVFLAITYGVCRNTIGRDLTYRDCIRLMLGKSLPTFSKALLHDSQACYIIIMGIAAITLTWFCVWLDIEPTLSFGFALAPPYVVLVNILTCRVFRNTKLGLYKKVPLQSNDSKSQTHAAPNGMSWNSSHGDTTDDHSGTVTPIQIAVSRVVDYKSDYPPMMESKRPVEFLDFGMV